VNLIPQSPDRRAQRRELRRLRAAMTAGSRLQADQRIARTLALKPWLGNGRSAALYVSASPEVDTAMLRQLCARRGCTVYLPRISDYRNHRIVLCRDRGLALRPNRFGIGEPPAGPAIDPRLLTLIVLPVLGFDARGTRLGSGAGYYDRLLSGLPRAARRPRLIGLAYDCQRAADIPALDHDVPLDGVITESGLHWFVRDRNT